MIYYLVTGKLRRDELGFLKRRHFYFRTCLFTGYLVLFYFAIGIIDRSELPLITLLNYLWPTFTMLLSVIILKQPSRLPILLLGSVIVFVGLAIEIVGENMLAIITSGGSVKTAIAAVSATVAAFTWGLYTVLNRKWGEKAGATLALPFVMLIASAALGVLRWAFEEQSSFTPDVYLPLTYLLFIPFLANVCWDVGTRRGSITVLSLLADGLPWASLTVASLYLGIAIDARTWISAVLIVSGALISRYSLRATTPNEDPAPGQ